MYQDKQINSDSKRELKLNILLVDDHALNRFMVQTILEQWKCKIIIAQDGLEAIQRLISHKEIDLILMDMRMPVMDGKTASEFIRTRLRSTIPVIAITSDAIQYGNNTESRGITYFISKPFTQDELYEKSLLALEARIPALPESCMDLGKLMKDEDPKFIARMIDLFLEDTPDKLIQIEKAIGEKQPQALMDIAHTIKPSLQYLASASVSETALNVEKNTDPSGSLIYAEALLLMSELAKLSEELKIFRSGLDT